MLPRVLAVVVKASHEALRTGDYMVEPGSDQAENEYEDQSVPDVIWVLASPLGSRAPTKQPIMMQVTVMMRYQSMGRPRIGNLKATGSMV